MIPGESMPGGVQPGLPETVRNRLTSATGHPKQIR
jgi:hypothetical protein